MSQDERELTGPQIRTVAVLVTASSIEEAAQEARVARSTVHRWLQDAGFREALRRARATMFDETMGRLQSATAQSVTALCDLLKSSEEAIRLRAALGILGLGLKAREVIDLAERIQRLEEIIEEGMK